MKIANKIVLLFLATCMLIVPLASCSDKGDSNTQTQAPAGNNNGSNNNNPSGDEDALPPHQTYGGTPVVIFSWNPDQPDFVLDEDDAYNTKRTQALWERNLAIEEHLGITISYVTMDGHYDQMNNFIKTLEASISVGDAAFDLVQQYNLTAAVATMRGLYLDIAQNPEVNLTDAPYWSAEIKEELSYNGKVYFMTGDIAPTVLGLTACMAYNKDMIRDLNLENPYQLHKNNEWTWDKFFELCKNVYIDQGDQGVDSYDRYGWGADAVFYDVSYHSIGLRLVEKDADGALKISEDLYSDKAYTFVTHFQEFLDSEDVGFIYEDLGDNKAYDNSAAFNSKNLLFLTTYMSCDYDVKFGVMPPPKYDSQQDRYYTLLNMRHSQFSIPYDTPSFEVSGAALEYLAMESYRSVTPAIFEDTFKTELADAPEDAEMFDVIRASITWDFGRIYGETLGGLYSGWRKIFQYGASDPASQLKSNAEYSATKLEAVCTTLASLKR